jgi:hypothetical protein
MKLLNDLNLWPPNGWTYEQVDTGFVFAASSLQELADKVRLHREANGLKFDSSLEMEIQDQIIHRSPKWFKEWREEPPLRG